MANPSSARATMSGGFLLAISIVLGVGIGAWKGQATIGFLIGLGVGLALLLAVWVIDRSRA
jgi:hypothetical protein